MCYEASIYSYIKTRKKKTNKYQIITIFVPILAAHTQCKKTWSTLKRKKKTASEIHLQWNKVGSFVTYWSHFDLICSLVQSLIPVGYIAANKGWTLLCIVLWIMAGNYCCRKIWTYLFFFLIYWKRSNSFEIEWPLFQKPIKL